MTKSALRAAPDRDREDLTLAAPLEIAGTGVADEPLEQAERWRRAGRRVALATVVRTWGSAPRATGSHLVVNDEGAFVGSVSGGCVEGAVVAGALDAIADGRPRLLEFGVPDEDAWAIGLACGGQIQVYVERIG